MGNSSTKENESYDKFQKYEKSSGRKYSALKTDEYTEPQHFGTHNVPQMTQRTTNNVPLYPQFPALTQAIAPPYESYEEYNSTNQISKQRAIAPPYEFIDQRNSRVRTSTSPSPASYNDPIFRFNFPENVNGKEPMLLLDTTGSMNLNTFENNKTPRNNTTCEIIRCLISKLEAKDSHTQNDAPNDAPNEEHNYGMICVTFANSKANNIGNINSNNLKQKWNQIEWSGRTIIMPGWNEMKRTFDEKFGERNVDERPLLFAFIVTDGEAEDIDEFAATLATDENSYAVIVLMGFGKEHDKALISFNNVAQSNPRVRVIPFKATTNPKTISVTLLKMLS